MNALRVSDSLYNLHKSSLNALYLLIDFGSRHLFFSWNGDFHILHKHAFLFKFFLQILKIYSINTYRVVQTKWHNFFLSTSYKFGGLNSHMKLHSTLFLTVSKKNIIYYTFLLTKIQRLQMFQKGVAKLNIVQ